MGIVHTYTVDILVAYIITKSFQYSVKGEADMNLRRAVGAWACFFVMLLVAFTLQGKKVDSKPYLAKLEGNELEIAKKSGDQQNPHTIFLPDKNLWFVVYEDWSEVSKGAEIKGRFVRPDGSLCGGEITLSSDQPGNGNQTVPRAAYRDGAGKVDSRDLVFVAWQDTSYTGIYYAALDVTGYTASESVCAALSVGSMTSVEFEDDDFPTDGIIQSYTTSRTSPKVIYDPAKDRFVMAWVDSKSIGKTISYVPFPLPGTPVNWTFGDALNIGFCAVKGDLSGFEINPRSVGKKDEGGPHYTRARKLSSSKTAYYETRTYEYFDEVANLDLACDTTSPECLVVVEGKRIVATVANSCADDPSETKNIGSNGICDSDDIVTSDLTLSAPDQGIYMLYEKYFNFVIPSYQISSGETHYPSVGFDPQTKKFLITWEDLRESAGLSDGKNQKIFGQLVLSGSGLYNNNFIVSFQDTDGDGIQDENVMNSKQTRPYVSYDSVNQRFFVAWQDGRNGSVSLENLDIYGQYVDSEGTLRGTNYAISTSNANQAAPAIAYNSIENQFLAVWKDARNLSTTASDIYGQRFTLGQPQLTLLKIDNTPLAPALIDFGSITVGQFSTSSFKIRNTGDIEINVDCIQPDPGTLTPFSFDNLPAELNQCEDAKTLTLVPSAEVTLTTRFSPTEKGTFTSSFTIKSDAGDRTVNFQGIGVSPDITIQEGDDTQDGTLDFGQVVLGQSKDLTLQIINNGTISYNITSISGLGAGFEIINPPNYPYSMAPGATLSLTLRFTPTVSGNYSQQLVVNTDVSGLSRTVKLLGVCIAPILNVDVTDLDYGVVKVGETKTLTITVKNVGNSDLHITQCALSGKGFGLANSCPATITPGQKPAEIGVNFSPSDVVQYNGTLTIISDGGQKTISLKGQGAGGKISISPSQLDFGTVVVNSLKTLTVEISNSGNVEYTITSISSSGEEYTLTYAGTPPIKVLPGTAFSISVSFKAGKKGSYSGQIVIENDAVNSTNKKEVINLQASAIEADITVEEGDGKQDGVLDFGEILINQQKDLSLGIINSGIISYNVTSISGLGAGFEVVNAPTFPYSLAPGGKVQITVRFKPSVAGTYLTQLIVNTDASGVTKTITLTGKGKSGVLKVSPVELDYGQVKVGESKVLSVTVANEGDADLQVNQCGIDGIGFSVADGCALTLVAGATKEIGVKFSPTDVVDYNGTLTVTSNVGAKSVSLKGQGAGGKISISPAQLDFGTVVVNSTKTMPLQVSNTGNMSYAISGISNPSSPYTLNYTGGMPIELLPGTSYNINVTFSPSTPGFYTGNIKITNNAVNSQGGVETILFQGQAISANITIDPSQLAFEAVAVGSTQTKSLKIKNNTQKEVIIKKINSPLSPFALENPPSTPYTIGAGGDLDILVNFSPTAAGTYGSSISILFDVNPTPVTINLSGTALADIVQKGEILFNEDGVYKSALDFKSVLVNQIETKTIVIENTGSSSVTINSLNVSSSIFKLGTTVSTPFTLSAANSPGYTKAIQIKFAPIAAQDYNATFSLQQSDGYIYQLLLIGKGVNSVAGSTTTGAIVESTELTENELPGTKPSTLTVKQALGIYVTNFTTPSVVLKAKFNQIPTNPIFYKINKNNIWCTVYPNNTCNGISNVSLTGTELTFTIQDNSDADKDPNSGVIYDPIVLGETTTITPPGGDGGTSPGGETGGGGGGGSCFIATAAFGSGMDPYVLELKRFRDDFLLKSRLGRSFVEIYYRYSPPVADFIRDNELAKSLVRVTLYPVVWFVMYPYLCVMILTVFILGFVLVRARRRTVLR